MPEAEDFLRTLIGKGNPVSKKVVNIDHRPPEEACTLGKMFSPEGS